MNKKSITKESSGMLYRRIVLKFGTSLLTGGTSRLNLERIEDLENQGHPVQAGTGIGWTGAVDEYLRKTFR
jgi:hypothetical protein